MILTVTPNTALERVLEIEHYESGRRLPVRREHECIGGKGNLVSVFAVQFGVGSVSLGFAAGESGRRLARSLRQRGVRADFSPAEGETRRTVVVVDDKRPGQTWLIPEALRVNRAAERDLEKRVARWLPKAAWLVLCGSLPAGCSPLLYRRLTDMAHARKVPVLVDSRGPALLHALKAQPEVVKVNDDELAKTFGLASPRTAGFGIGPRPLAPGPAELFVCTKGSEGVIAVLLGQKASWFIAPPRIRMRSSAGSGDAFTAALLAWRERGAEWSEALRWACAAGTAKALEARTDRLDLDTMRRLFRRVRVKKLEPKA